MLTAVILLVVGLAAGSFVNALVWRLHQQSKNKKSRKYSIMHGRSMCPNCQHILNAKDLIPIFSWLMLRGKCRYCHKPISWQYPLVEAVMAAVFLLSYIFWPADLTDGQWILLITWLVSSMGLMALLIYDLRWMILPNKMIYPTALAAIVGRLTYILGFSSDKTHDLLWWALSVAIASGLFLLLYIISQGKWIGYGDVRLGLITGTILADPKLSFLMIFMSSFLGIIYVLPLLAAGKKSLSAKVSYGPFLIAATWITLLFGQPLISWYKELILR